MSENRSAKSVTGFPVGEHGEDHFWAKVGQNFPYHDKSGPIVDMITVAEDLPGLHCNLETKHALDLTNN